MPKRNDDTVKENHNDDLVDLNFLPQEYIDRINEMFDAYFNLGMKRRTDSMEVSIPIFPNKVTTLSSPELGDLHSQYRAWYSYAADKQKYVLVATDYVKKELQKALDAELGLLVMEKGNIEAKKAHARSSSNYQLIAGYASKLDGILTLLDREIDSYDRSISSLSREITRREHNFGQ